MCMAVLFYLLTHSFLRESTCEREGERESHEGKREREGKKVWSPKQGLRLLKAGLEPDGGLELMNCEILT